MSYERTAASMERAEGQGPESVSGILASDGEASDTHILDIDGGELGEGPPMLFGHDDFSGSRNLGSWNRFDRIAKGTGRAIRAHGTIALGGDGAGKAWRNDVAYMVNEGHITGLSIRWDPIDDPVRRTSLPSDHPAHVGHKDKRGNGLFFPRWSMLEGSVVTLPSDQSAVIGRMAETNPEVRAFYRAALNDALAADVGPSAELVGVALGEDEFAYVERRVYDAMLELANERYSLALDLYERMVVGIDPPEELTSEPEAVACVSSAQDADLQKEQELKAAPLPAVTPRAIFGVLQERLARSRSQAVEQKGAALSRAKGKI